MVLWMKKQHLFVFCIAFARVTMYLFIYLHCKCKYIIINYLYFVSKCLSFQCIFLFPKLDFLMCFSLLFECIFPVPKTCISNTFFYHGAFSYYYNKLIIIRLSITVDLIFKVIKWAKGFIIILVLSEILILFIR